MPASIASCIERVEPERVSLTEHQRARLRVVGSAFGFVRCGDERRWVWGQFDETFVISALARGNARFDTEADARIDVRVWGLGGSAARSVPSVVQADLAPPRVRLRPKRLAFRAARPPRMLPLRAEQLSSSEETT